MSNREKLVSLIDTVPENQITIIYNTVSDLIKILSDAEDDAYCLALAEQAKKEDDGIRYSMDDLLKECEVTA